LLDRIALRARIVAAVARIEDDLGTGTRATDARRGRRPSGLDGGPGRRRHRRRLPDDGERDLARGRVRDAIVRRAVDLDHDARVVVVDDAGAHPDDWWRARAARCGTARDDGAAWQVDVDAAERAVVVADDTEARGARATELDH